MEKKMNRTLRNIILGGAGLIALTVRPNDLGSISFKPAQGICASKMDDVNHNKADFLAMLVKEGKTKATYISLSSYPKERYDEEFMKCLQQEVLRTSDGRLTAEYGDHDARSKDFGANWRFEIRSKTIIFKPQTWYLHYMR